MRLGLSRYGIGLFLSLRKLKGVIICCQSMRKISKMRSVDDGGRTILTEHAAYQA